jgi:hypothetical protein
MTETVAAKRGAAQNVVGKAWARRALCELCFRVSGGNKEGALQELETQLGSYTPTHRSSFLVRLLYTSKQLPGARKKRREMMESFLRWAKGESDGSQVEVYIARAFIHWDGGLELSPQVHEAFPALQQCIDSERAAYVDPEVARAERLVQRSVYAPIAAGLPSYEQVGSALGSSAAATYREQIEQFEAASGGMAMSLCPSIDTALDTGRRQKWDRATIERRLRALDLVSQAFMGDGVGSHPELFMAEQLKQQRHAQ